MKRYFLCLAWVFLFSLAANLPAGAQTRSSRATGDQGLSQSADTQAAVSGIQPVDDQAIANGLATASQSADASAAEARKDAFDAALDGVFPLKPNEIQTLFNKFHENQKAIQEPQTGNPTAVVKAETIPLEPGAEPREIDTDLGFITTISLLDSTGNPWPIQDVGVGGNFDVPAPEEGGNVLRVTPLTKYAIGNMSVRLVGLTTPLSFKLRASTGTVFYRYDARIPKFGPKAAAPLINHGNDLVAGDAMLMNILDGAPPLDATRLPVTGVDQRTAAWRVGQKVYVKTPFILLSPGWDGSVGSGDGTHVYLIPDTPVLLLSDNGNLIHARIGNNSQVDEQPVPAIEDGIAHPLRLSAAVSQNASSSALFTKGNDQILPSPNTSRTLIRPVPAQPQPQPAGNAQSAVATPAQNSTTTQSNTSSAGSDSATSP